MKFTSYEVDGEERYGLVDGGNLKTVGGDFRERYLTLRDAIAGNALSEIGDALSGADADLAVDDATLLPVIPKPDKILCVGLNYKSHIDETHNTVSEKPMIFTRFHDSQVGHNQNILKPKQSERLDYEGEMAVIIGKPARFVKPGQALEYVAGYACFNEGSVRDWQRHNRQFTPGKSFYKTGGFGPWMVTADEIPDPTKLTLETRLNGEVMQHATTDLMIFDIPALFEYITTFTELRPGDVIVSGTCGGVGDRRDPPVYMTDGDVAEVEISSIGILRNPIVNA